MRIVKVDTYPLLYPLQRPYGDANGYKKYRSSYLIRVETAAGIDGWGECVDYLPTLHTGLHERIVPFLIGQSALNRNEIVEVTGKWHQRLAAALCMALTEIAAKDAGLHLCEYWGGRRRAEVPLYASFQSYSESDNWVERSVELVGQAMDSGFTMAKLKIGGRSYCEDKRHIVEIQANYSDKLRIILDGNQSYDTAFTQKWRQLFQHWDNLLWLEEPIPFHLMEEYRLLRTVMGVPIAGGENMQGASDFLPILQSRAFDLLQPDPMHHTSIDAYRESLSLARQFGFRVSPHCYDGGLARLYSICAQACLPPWSKMNGEEIEPVEWDVMDNPFTQLFPLTIRQGMVTVPTGRGIGVQPNHELIEKYRWDGRSYDA